jgi:tRNA(Arg) A34 adenosine deaminase TadA
MISNEPVDVEKAARAVKIIAGLQRELITRIQTAGDCGPFLAAVYDREGRLIAKEANSVVHDKCSHCHAEMNALKAAERKLDTFDLAPHHVSLYITAEPCIMCLGGILWAGVDAVYYSVSSRRVEEITGFDEGFKSGWMSEFKKRGITVYGEIETALGEEALRVYMQLGKKIYKPR